MNQQELLKLNQFEEQAVRYQNSLDSIRSFSSKYSNQVNNPHIGYRIGEMFLVKEADIKEAIPFLVDSASQGLNPNNKYFNTLVADSIGHSFFYLLENYNFRFDKDLEYKLTCLAYLYLSNTIKNNPIVVYNSYRTRALLIDQLKNEKTSIITMLKKHYYSGVDLCKEILSFGDYLLAILGFIENGDMTTAAIMNHCKDSNKETILNQPQYKAMSQIDDEQLVNISSQNQNFLYEKILKGFQSGDFFIEEEKFINHLFY